MGSMTMNMSQGTIERNETSIPEYDDEILSSGWNPAVTLAQLELKDKRPSFSAELAQVDVGTFLDRMYD